jgi:hypothetical protein
LDWTELSCCPKGLKMIDNLATCPPSWHLGFSFEIYVFLFELVVQLVFFDVGRGNELTS